jgi:predicted outer membrane repeat protein
MINNCTFKNNFASSQGGAILSSGINEIQGSEFDNNTAYNGGALFTSGGVINNCHFNRNVAHLGGGAYVDTPQTISIKNSFFFTNEAINGSGIFINQAMGASIIDLCIFRSNLAHDSGAGMYIGNPPNTLSLTVQASQIEENTAMSTGAGIFLSVGQNTQLMNWKDNLIFNNFATGNNSAGGILLQASNMADNQINLWNNVVISANRPVNFACNQQNISLCNPSHCINTMCTNCSGICDSSTLQCYISMPSPVCDHGVCEFSGGPKCVCDSGWKGDLCNDSGTQEPLITLWYFWVGIGLGALLILIIIVLIYRRKAQYTEIPSQQ